jgi:hypothetical protein
MQPQDKPNLHYPKMKYHWTKDPAIVNNADDGAALGGGWADTPAAFAPYRGPRPPRFGVSSHAWPKAADKTGGTAAFRCASKEQTQNGTSRDRHGLCRHLHILVNQELAHPPGRQER